MISTIHLREQESGALTPDSFRAGTQVTQDDLSEIEANFVLLYRLRKPRLHSPIPCSARGCDRESEPSTHPASPNARFMCRNHSDLYAAERGKHFLWDAGTFRRMRELGFFEWSRTYREHKRDKELRVHESICGERSSEQNQNRHADIEQGWFQREYENETSFRGSEGNAPDGTDHIKGQGCARHGYWAPQQEWQIIQSFTHIVNSGAETPVWDLWAHYDGPREIYDLDRTFHGYIRREEGIQVTSPLRSADRDSKPVVVTKKRFLDHWSQRIKYGELYDQTDGPETFLVTPFGRVSREHPKWQQMSRTYSLIFSRVRPEDLYAGLTPKEQDAMRKIDQNEIQTMISQSDISDFTRWDKKDLLAAWRDRKLRAYFYLTTTDAPKVVTLDVPRQVFNLDIHPFTAGAERARILKTAFEPALRAAFGHSIEVAYESVTGDHAKKDAMKLVNLRYGPDFEHARETVQFVEFSDPETPWYEFSDDTMRLARAILEKESVKPNETQEIAGVFPDPLRTALMSVSGKTSSFAHSMKKAG